MPDRSAIAWSTESLPARPPSARSTSSGPSRPARTASIASVIWCTTPSIAASATSAPLLSGVSPPICAVAAGDQLGVPSPNRAGTHHGPPPVRAPGLIAGHSRGPSAPSRLSHTVTAPAFGTKPSSAKLVRAARRQAQVETTPAGAGPGGLVPALHHKNAPVPIVTFASPARTQPCPNSEACWSPASAPIGARPPQTAASVTPIRPAVGTIAGSICSGMSNRPSIAGSQRPAARSNSIVREAIDGSVTCTAPPLSRQISQQPTSPNSSWPLAAAARAPGTSSSSQRSLSALNAASSGSPVLDRTSASRPAARNSEQASAVLVSRQLIAGKTGLPVARSQTTKVSVCAASPSPATSGQPAPAMARHSRRQRSTPPAMSSASCSTRRAAGKNVATGVLATATGSSRASNATHRLDELPWSIASTMAFMPTRPEPA